MLLIRFLNMDNEFVKNPIKLIVLGADLQEVSRFVFVGDDSPIKTNKIDNIDELDKYKKELTIKYGDWKSKIGGSDDLMFLPEFELHRTPDVQKLEKMLSITSKPKTVVQQTENFKNINFVHDVILYPEDTISELKLKIYVATNIPIYRQHLYIKKSGNKDDDSYVIPLRYNIITDTLVSVNLQKSYELPGGRILDFPIDHNIFPNRNILRVISKDNETLASIYQKYGATSIYCMDLRTLLEPQVPSLREMINDRVQLELLYYSFIIKFWPMITIDVFETIIRNESELASEYPDLVPSISNLQKRFNLEKTLINRKYELIDDAIAGFKKYSDFRKFNPLNRSNVNSIVSISIKSATLDVKTTASISIDIRKLFDLLSTSNEIPIIKVNLILNRKQIILTKIGEKVPDIANVYDMVRYKLQLPTPNSLLFVQRVKDKFLVIVIKSTGQYQIKSTWTDEILMSFDEIFKLMSTSVKPKINMINDFGRNVFASPLSLPDILEGNSEFSNLDISMLIKQPLTDGQFDYMKKSFNTDLEAGIFKPNSSMRSSNSIDMSMFKGMTIDLSQIEKSIPISNYYQHLTDAKIKQKWISIMDVGKPINIQHRTTDIKLDISNLRESEFRYMYSYFVARIYSIIENMPTNLKKRTKTTTDSNLKLLKERDPILYKFKIFGSDLVYSRLCQNKHQPIILDVDEYEALDQKSKANTVKYWNFTTQKPVYYRCPNPAFPNLSFITEKHPKNYCLPCCKITPSYQYDITTGDKKSNIYNTCVEKHTFNIDETDTGASRYIMIYGKQLDIGRISKLPDLLDKYFKYNLSEQDIENSYRTGPIPVVFPDGKKNIYNIEMLWRLTKNNTERQIPIKELEPFLFNKTWSYQTFDEPDYSPMDIIKNPNLSSTHYSRITNADVSFPILIYRNINGGWIKVIDGLHRLSKLWLSRKSDDDLISVKYITKRQLSKAETTTVDKKSKTDELKKPNYYLYGVPQNITTITDVGCIYALATSLRMSPDQFILECVSRIKANTSGINMFKTLLGGILIQYFVDLDHLLNTISQIESQNIQTLVNFPYWNELFIEIVKYCWSVYTIIFDDKSVNIAGTSIKHTEIKDDISLILPLHVNDVDDIIPTSTEKNPTTREYIIMVRKYKKTRGIFTYNYLYYPIFVIIPHDFFKTLKIEKTIFVQDDPIIKELRNLISSTLKTSNPLGFNIPGILLLGATITRCWTTLSNRCYAVEVKWNSKTLIIPVHYCSPKYPIVNEPLLRKNIKQTYSDIRKFINAYNEKLKSISKSTSTSNTDLNSNLIYVEKFLVLNNMIIGCVSYGLYIYFKPEPVSKKLPEKLIYHLYQDPDTINNHIWKYSSSEKSVAKSHLKLLPQALDKKYAYNLFIVELFNVLDKETNTNIRNKIKKFIYSLQINDLKNKVNTILEFDEDKNTFDVLFNDFYLEHYDKKDFLKQFESLRYKFDRITLNKIESITHDYQISSTDERNLMRNKTYEIIEKVASKHHIKYTKDWIDIFISDLVNPLKRQYLLSAVYLGQTIDEYKFIKKIGEQIYIKV